MDSSSSVFESFKSKKILRSSSPLDQKLQSDPTVTPATPLRGPRRCLMSVKEVREAAESLRAGSKAKPDEAVGGSGLARSRKKKADRSNALSDKYELLCNFFDMLHCSLRLLRLKGRITSLKNITPQIETLMTNRRFSITHLAQIKFILPEAVELKMVLVHDAVTSSMKPDLQVELNVGAIKNDEDSNDLTQKPDIKSIFRSRVLDFIKAHPEEEIPKAPLPEPFNVTNVNLDISSEKASSSSLLNETSTGAILEQKTAVASHLPKTFQKRFSKQASSQPITVSVAKPITQVISSTVVDSQAKVLFYPLPETPIKGIDHVKNKVYSSEGTPFKDISTPLKIMSATPAIPPPKRCYMTPDADLANSPNKLVRRPVRNRSLVFDTPVKSAKVEEEVKSSAGDLSSDDDLFDILPKSLVQSIREKELKIQEDNDPAISQAKRRRQMIANLPKLFDMIRYSLQSSKSCVITKEELVHKLMTTQLDIIDRKEVEEQLVLLKELVPDLIYEKLASGGDLLIGINKTASPELIRARLVQSK